MANHDQWTIGMNLALWSSYYRYETINPISVAVKYGVRSYELRRKSLFQIRERIRVMKRLSILPRRHYYADIIELYIRRGGNSVNVPYFYRRRIAPRFIPLGEPFAIQNGWPEVFDEANHPLRDGGEWSRVHLTALWYGFYHFISRKRIYSRIATLPALQGTHGFMAIKRKVNELIEMNILPYRILYCDMPAMWRRNGNQPVRVPFVCKTCPTFGTRVESY